ncbi:FAD-binding protein [Glaciihabitans arcticus]|uniref:FAD-binding protein n=1 Tax=Glaciihabitans arcticus TaxID=2668039 RepID=A0A4V6MTP7_9MICO|nr:FAD-binding protein [Glaciihabitans arcticus]
MAENWARSYTYTAAEIAHPGSVEEIRELVASTERIRALGTRHSFTALPDTVGTLVALDRLPARTDLDETARTVTVAGGLRYGDVATALQARGWALHNLASLPHISVAGAIATGTHGSGDGNGTLSSAVAALELVTASGELVTLRRGDPDFDGAVVALGALGVVTAVTLDVQPTFDVRQDMFDDLPWSSLLNNLDAVTGSAYSVSLFTTWAGDTIPAVWLKSRMDAPAPPTDLLGATRQPVGRHMIPDQPASNTTELDGVPGPWSDRLAHFKLGFTPSNGDELQSEYLVPRHNAVEALVAVRELRDAITPLLHVTEVRTMSADTLWLSGAYGTDAVAIHFTWKKLPTEVAAVLPAIEALLLPLGARPHWGKLFDRVERANYPRLDDFRALVANYDPSGKFGSTYLDKHLGL